MTARKEILCGVCEKESAQVEDLVVSFRWLETYNRTWSESATPLCRRCAARRLTAIATKMLSEVKNAPPDRV